MTEYSRIAKGRFTSTGAAQIINLPFRPDFVEIINYTAAATPANHGVPFAKWDVNMGQGFAVEEVFNATPVLTTDVVTTNGITSFSAGQLLQYGPTYQHTGSTDFSISKANPAVVTTTTNHNLASGDVVIFGGLFQTSTTGMPQLDGIPFTVTVTGLTTFTIPWNTNQSNYTAFDSSTSTGNVGFFKKVLYPYLYFPGTTFISNITLGTTTTIDTTDAHNFVVGQEVAFRIPSLWGTTQLNSLPNTLVPGSPVYGYVISVTDYNTVIVNIDSSAMTAFNSNQTVASVPGLSYPQIVAAGDVNTGGVQISANSPLYPPPYFVPIGTTQVSTINGPAILGSYVNNTSQGFIVGAGAGTNDTSSVLVGANGNVIYWRAFLHDFSSP
jgi:ubiquitin-activating enzyme E1-like protein